MLFAEAAADLPIFNYITQGGALAILAYHFLRGLPQMQKDSDASHERAVDKVAAIIASKDAAYLERSKGLRTEIADLRHHLGCRYPVGPKGPFSPPSPEDGPPARPGGGV